MKDIIAAQLLTASSLADIELMLIPVLREQRKSCDQLGYVSGVITTDGPEYVASNIAKLVAHTERLRETHSYPIFSPTDVFTDSVYGQISADTISSSEFKIFWRNVLSTQLITDVFMTPRWEVSGGARDEHEAASQLNLIIHYLS